MPLRKRLTCKIIKVSSETANRTTSVAALRSSASASSSSPVQQQTILNVNAQSRTLKSESPNQPIGYETFPLPSVLLGYDLEDRLKNLIISVLEDNANLAARQIRYDPFFSDSSSETLLKYDSEAEREGPFIPSPKLLTFHHQQQTATNNHTSTFPR